MVKNLWDKVRLFCMEHEKPVRMYEGLIGTHASYVCAKRVPKTEDNPEGYEDAKNICMNEIRYDDIFDIVEKRIGKEIEENAGTSAQIDLKGMRFSYRGYEMVVLKSTDKHIDIGIRRKRGDS